MLIGIVCNTNVKLKDMKYLGKDIHISSGGEWRSGEKGLVENVKSSEACRKLI